MYFNNPKTIYIREYDVFLLYQLDWMTTVNIDIAVKEAVSHSTIIY